MRQFQPGPESGHDHFFATFGKFGAPRQPPTEMLAEAKSRAATDHLQYMELMFNPDGGEAEGLARAWVDDDLGAMRDKLFWRKGFRKFWPKPSTFLTIRKRRSNRRCIAVGRRLPLAAPFRRVSYQVSRGPCEEIVFCPDLAGL